MLRAVLSGLFLILIVGCGGGGAEKADTSHLDAANNPDAKAASEAAAEKYKNMGKNGPGGPPKK